MQAERMKVHFILSAIFPLSDFLPEKLKWKISFLKPGVLQLRFTSKMLFRNFRANPYKIVLAQSSLCFSNA
jgi:hypothetical protein